MHMLTAITDNNSLNPHTYTAIRRLILSLWSLDRVFFSARAGIYLNTLFLTFKSYRLTLPECIRRISRVVLLFVSKAARGFVPFVLKCVLFDCMFVCMYVCVCGLQNYLYNCAFACALHKLAGARKFANKTNNTNDVLHIIKMRCSHKVRQCEIILRDGMRSERIKSS